MRFLIISGILLASIYSNAQITLFPEQCAGEWQGNTVIFRNGVPMDTIPCGMSIAQVVSDSIWTWKTTYYGASPVIKDYRMILPDRNTNYYILDEGDGLELRSYQSGSSMYSNFAVQGSLLTSRYTLDEGKLIFEITSGSISDTTANDILNYSIPIVQYSELTRVK